MKGLTLTAFLLFAVSPGILIAQTAVPEMKTVVPMSGVSGDLLTVTGAHLGRANVAALYLTDEKNDVKVPIVQETATIIQFKIPPGIKPGNYALMVLTQGRNPEYVEEPVRVRAR